MQKLDRCPACDGGEIKEAIAADAAAWERYIAYSAAKYAGLLDNWLTREELCIDHCMACGHHWYRYQPDQEQLGAMYANGCPLKNVNVGISRNPTDTMREQMQKLLQMTRNRYRPSLLDYGSGFGRWSRAAAVVGFDVTAYEPVVERGAEDAEIEFALVNDRASLAGKRYDAVNLEQVLEHVPDPYRLLSDLHSFCTQNTIIRITVPNILRCPEGDRLWAEWPFDGSRAHTMAPFEHLHGFTPKSLRALVRRARFTPMPLWNMAGQYPLAVLRRFGGAMFPSLDQTFLVITPMR